MKRRNWLDLSRKLVDRYDLNDTLSYIQTSLGQEALAYWGEGVLITKIYPNPFPITLSSGTLSGSVGPGIAYDPTGQIIENDGTVGFVVTSNPSNPTWSLLVARYKMTGDTPVPKPSDPISTVFLNLHDDFDIAVISGTPSGVPAYPAKLTNDIILAGLQIPAGATLGTQIVVDTTIQEQAYVPATRVTVDTTQLVVTKKKDVQSQINSYDSFLLLGALTLSSDNTVHDYAFITCNSGGTNGDSITIAGQTFTIGTSAALNQIPVQVSAQALAYELARRIRELPAFSSLYTAAAANGKLALYSIQPGSVGGALSVSGGSFSVDRSALSGNGPRKILNLPGIAAQLDQADFYMNTLVPPSTVIFKAGADIPAGWLYCDGSAVSRTTYANLFNEIGATYGAGDGSTTFNIPDLRGKTAIGDGQGTYAGASVRVLGDFLGEETHQLSVAELASHAHSDAGHAHGVYDPGHSHSWRSGQGFAAGGAQAYARNDAGFNFNGPETASGTGIGIYAASANIQNTGGDQPHNIMQPSLVLKAFIKY